ncbi:MAG TPA: hypothetical protein V6C85_33375 [Allocoleopsis sp.]
MSKVRLAPGKCDRASCYPGVGAILRFWFNQFSEYSQSRASRIRGTTILKSDRITDKDALPRLYFCTDATSRILLVN